MLSSKNIDKLVMTGLYSHKPEKKYRSELYSDDLYWCCNWTFTITRNTRDDKWYMVDTYFRNMHIELTDDNFDEFKFLLDFNEVKTHSGKNIWEYDESDWWCLAVDSGGIDYPKYFIRKNAVKNKDRVLSRIQEEIAELEQELKNKKKDYEKVLNDDVNLNYV